MKKMMKKLLNTKMKFTSNQKGLTLIELLVVIVILGIIAAIAIPAISSQRAEANENAAKQTNAVIRDAAQRYAAVDSDYNASTDSTVTMSDLTATGKSYFQEKPICPDSYPATEKSEAADLLTYNYCTGTDIGTDPE